MSGPADERQQIISAALDDVARTQRRRAAIEAVESTRKPMRDRASLVGLIALLPVLGLLVVSNVTGQSLTALLRPSPPPAEARGRAEEALWIVVEDVESFRRDYSELPGSLAEVGLPVNGDWSYVPSGEHYQITLTYHGQTVRFDSRTRVKR